MNRLAEHFKRVRGGHGCRERNMGQDNRGFGFERGARGPFGFGGFAERFGGEGHGPDGERGRHGFGGRGRGPGRGMRMFGAGDLRFVILRLIAEQPRHGYDLIKEIEERLGGGYAPSPGVIYPMLTMLEEMGQATVVTEGTRKLYSITDEGQKALEEQKVLVDGLFARMHAVREERGRVRAPGIERAVENLKMALRMRHGALTTEQTHAITDILDAAAKQIERL